MTLPAYVYDVDGVREAAKAACIALGQENLVAYAVKANSAGTLIRAARSAGAGADVVSGAELELAVQCGVEPSRIVMSGVAKRDDEIDRALSLGIRALQAESVEELQRIAARAHASGRRARVSIRLNPDVSIDSHAHISTGHKAAKFGVIREAWSEALQTIRQNPCLQLLGVSVHVGSMLMSVEPYLASARVACETARAWISHGHALEFIDFGGGFGIDLGNGAAPAPKDFAAGAVKLLKDQGLQHLQLAIEPGRSLVGPYGVLLAEVVQAKVAQGQHFALINAGMNDLLRPALYGARHRIEPLQAAPSGRNWRVAGPVCESADDFGEHQLAETLPAAVAIRDAGAYGFTLSSEYNGRPQPCEVFVQSGVITHFSPSPGADAWIRRRARA